MSTSAFFKWARIDLYNKRGIVKHKKKVKPGQSLTLFDKLGGLKWNGEVVNVLSKGIEFRIY